MIVKFGVYTGHDFCYGEETETDTYEEAVAYRKEYQKTAPKIKKVLDYLDLQHPCIKDDIEEDEVKTACKRFGYDFSQDYIDIICGSANQRYRPSFDAYTHRYEVRDIDQHIYTDDYSDCDIFTEEEYLQKEGK